MDSGRSMDDSNRQKKGDVGSTTYSSCNEAVGPRLYDSMVALLSEAIGSSSMAIWSTADMPPHYHKAQENSAAASQAGQLLDNILTVDTNGSNLQQEPWEGILSSDQKLDSKSLSGELYSLFSQAELAELPPLDTKADDISGPLLGPPITISDYCVNSVEITNGMLVIEEVSPEVRHSPPGPSLPARMPSNSISIDTEYRNDGSNHDANNRIGKYMRLSVDRSCTNWPPMQYTSFNRVPATTQASSSQVGKFADDAQYHRPCPKFPSSTLANNSEVAGLVSSAGPNNGIKLSPLFPGHFPDGGLGSSSQIALSTNHGCSSNPVNLNLRPPILDAHTVFPQGSSRFATALSANSRGEAPSTSSDGQVDMDGKSWNLILAKQLTKTDLRRQPSGAIYLQKKNVTSDFPDLQNKQAEIMNFYDLDLKLTWELNYQLFEYRDQKGGRRRTYGLLRHNRELIMVHNLQVGNWLRIYKAESPSGASYALRVNHEP